MRRADEVRHGKTSSAAPGDTVGLQCMVESLLVDDAAAV
jgi:hypothetical protein